MYDWSKLIGIKQNDPFSLTSDLYFRLHYVMIISATVHESIFIFAQLIYVQLNGIIRDIQLYVSYITNASVILSTISDGHEGQ